VINIYKFAHIADCHIGSQKHPELKKIELQLFEKCLNKCLAESVDFIIISGDLFHSNLPDMNAVKFAVERLKKLKDKGISIYVNYGSHDYSPNETSIIDLLESAGLIQKIVEGKVENEKIILNFFTDPKTGAKICGVSARKTGLEKIYFKNLDFEKLEKESGFKIFVFHSAITEFKPEFLAEMDSIPLSCFPKGFDYYAGGHIHQHSYHFVKEYGVITYPGTLFGSYSKDLELSANGEKRGFYIVNFDDKLLNVEFKEISLFDYDFIHFEVTGRNSIQAQNELLDKLAQEDVTDKIVLIKISGELSGGKTSNIDSRQIRSVLIQNGAKHVSINRHNLTSKILKAVKIMENDIPTLERKLFTENIGSIKVVNQNLKNDKGINLANDLLMILRQEKKPNEKKNVYEERIKMNALNLLHVGEKFNDH
jgi:DNA repair protein SbcD/Mre11